MATVGALSPGGHFPGEQRPARRPQFREETVVEAKQDVSREIARDGPTARAPEFGINAYAWPALPGPGNGGRGGSGGGEGPIPGAPHTLEERFRAVNIGEKNLPNWVRHFDMAPHGTVASFPLQRPESAPRTFPDQGPGGPGGPPPSREGTIPVAPAFRQAGRVGGIEGRWPPLVVPSSRTTTGTTPAVPILAALPATVAAAGPTPAVIAPVDTRDAAATIPPPRMNHMPRSSSCDGWVEAACAGPPSSGTCVASSDSRRRANADKQLVRPTMHVGGSGGGAGTRPAGKSPPSRKNTSPSKTPRGRPRGKDWDGARSSTPPSPPRPPPPPQQQQKQQQQQQQQQQALPHPHVQLHPQQRFSAWDGAVHAPPVSPPRQQQTQQQRQVPGGYETVYWRQAPGAHPQHRPLQLVLTPTARQMIMHHQHREQHQKQALLQQHEEQHQREQLKKREQLQQRDQKLMQQARHQRETLQPREQQQQQQQQREQAQKQHRDQQRGRARTETIRNVLQGPAGPRLSPGPQDTSRRPPSPSPSSMGRAGPAPAGEWRHLANGGDQQHQSPTKPQQVYYPPPGSNVGPGGARALTMAATSVLSQQQQQQQQQQHRGFPHRPESGRHAVHLALPVPIFSIVSPAMFAPYAVVARIPVHRQSGVNGSGAAGSSANGYSSGATGAVGSGGVANGDGGERRGSGTGGATNCSGNSTAHLRVRSHAASSLPQESRGGHVPRRRAVPRDLGVLATAHGTAPDNRSEVIAEASALEKRRRVEGRVACDGDAMAPRPRPSPPAPAMVEGEADELEVDIGVDFGDFGTRKEEDKKPANGWGPPRKGVGPVEGGWDEYDRVGTASGYTSTISSIERGGDDARWGGMSCSVSSSEEAGRWEESGGSDASGGVSASGSSTRSAMSDADEEEQQQQGVVAWSAPLRKSVGIVTDLVLPHQVLLAAVNVRNGGVGAEVEGVLVAEKDEDDEDEREMDAALEVVYQQGSDHLKNHARRNLKGTQERALEAWLATRTPQEQTAYLERTQR